MALFTGCGDGSMYVPTAASEILNNYEMTSAVDGLPISLQEFRALGEPFLDVFSNSLAAIDVIIQRIEFLTDEQVINFYSELKELAVHVGTLLCDMNIISKDEVIVIANEMAFIFSIINEATENIGFETLLPHESLVIINNATLRIKDLLSNDFSNLLTQIIFIADNITELIYDLGVITETEIMTFMSDFHNFINILINQIDFVSLLINNPLPFMDFGMLNNLPDLGMFNDMDLSGFNASVFNFGNFDLGMFDLSGFDVSGVENLLNDDFFDNILHNFDVSELLLQIMQEN